MYVAQPYRENRLDIMTQAINSRSFGTIISCNNGRVELTHLPFIATERSQNIKLMAHFARANRHWRILKENPEVTISFVVEDGYISSSWYPSKRETGKAVPTWNYIAIEVRGIAQLIESSHELLHLVEELTKLHESTRPDPWSNSDAPVEYTSTMLKHIVGVDISVTEIVGSWKLGQKKSNADRFGAVSGLMGEANGAGLAASMAQLLE
jgi:transcriptional regulator